MNLADYDSSADRADGPRLRERFRADSFLFFRGLLDPQEVAGVRRAVLERLRSIGWLAEGNDPDAALPGEVLHHDRGVMDGRPVIDPGWREGYRAVQSLEALHRLAHDPGLRAVLALLLGERVVVHPRKIARISFPGLVFPTPPHQDALFNQIPVDVLTVWIPLGDCPAELGSLRVLRGSANQGVRPVFSEHGLGGESVDVPLDAPDWVGGDYRCGDAIVFHSRTVHMTPPNLGGAVRLSMDCRFQSADDPVKPAALMPHGYSSKQLPGWSDLTSGWRTARWVEVDEPVRIAAVPGGRPQRSRLLHETHDHQQPGTGVHG
ncbi:phytanoyl-CoA dioxygenase family protein [Kitasatospora atroaurantiaca]|uniref:Phytanoyl-CoA dioxygenase PhyH n=1 Tax=Kitasatospora atroaurantiaca TaxID=285545 RepID=A0A561EIV1_9ACTN|nr:phytanoyl-CoA dioxygenase family protein [Kitasatospora atroaurantiaca]TWE15534.1 phytanoyl-CoA dioxygenase PhyH [Kitasatospora atroaurantiaca]